MSRAHISNIAEGAARQGNKEFIQFLYIALGSTSELETQLEVSRQIGYSNAETLVQLERNVERMRKMLQGLIRAVKTQ